VARRPEERLRRWREPMRHRRPSWFVSSLNI
jgi:hypothetical protein